MPGKPGNFQLAVLVALPLLTGAASRGDVPPPLPPSLSIPSYIQSKNNLKKSCALVIDTPPSWKSASKTQKADIFSALKNVYFQKRLDHFYIVGEKKAKGALELTLPGVDKEKISLHTPLDKLFPLHSVGNRILYQYRGRGKGFVLSKLEKDKNINRIKWKLQDALLPVRLHKNRKSFLTGDHSAQFIVNNRFTFLFTSKDAIFAKHDKGALFLLLYAQKTEEPPAQSIRSCQVSLYMVDEDRKVEVLDMADINPAIEEQVIGKDGWLLRAQIAQAPRRMQGIGFVVKSEITVSFDDFVLFVFS
jgi:hypothetical protein